MVRVYSRFISFSDLMPLLLVKVYVVGLGWMGLHSVPLGLIYSCMGWCVTLAVYLLLRLSPSKDPALAA